MRLTENISLRESILCLVTSEKREEGRLPKPSNAEVIFLDFSENYPQPGGRKG